MRKPDIGEKGWNSITWQVKKLIIFRGNWSKRKYVVKKEDKTKHEDKTQRGGHPKIIFKKMRGIFSLCLSISDNRVRSSHWENGSAEWLESNLASLQRKLSLSLWLRSPWEWASTTRIVRERKLKKVRKKFFSVEKINAFNVGSLICVEKCKNLFPLTTVFNLY